jgi:hypothetical protein
MVRIKRRTIVAWRRRSSAAISTSNSTVVPLKGG